MASPWSATEATDALHDALIGIAERRLGRSDLAALLRNLAS